MTQIGSKEELATLLVEADPTVILGQRDAEEELRGLLELTPGALMELGRTRTALWEAMHWETPEDVLAANGEQLEHIAEWRFKDRCMRALLGPALK